jgi:hypothetical protein
MGPCSSSTKSNVQYNNGGVNYSNNPNPPYVQRQTEEFYYQNVQLNTVFGKNEFGPNEKVQFNFAIRNSYPNQRFSAIISLSYDNTGNLSSYQQIGVLNEEVCDGNGSLDFKMSLLIDYFFEKNQYLKIELKSFDRSYIISTTLGKVVGSRGQTAIFPLNNTSQESILISASTVKDNNIHLFMNLKAFLNNSNNNDNIFYLIKKKKFMDTLPPGIPTSTPMVGVNDTTKDYVIIYKSEIKQNQKVGIQFKQMKIPTNFLSNGNFDHPFLIEFHNASRNQILGIHCTTINKIRSETNFSAGIVSISCSADTVKDYTFIDYLKGGVRLSLSIGIDFTGSNGSPRSQDSLHYQDPMGRPSPYQAAIKSCGDIVAYYDYDQIFPVFGYGAEIPGFYDVSHCFPISLESPEINTIDNVIAAYKNIVPKINFSGPTYFAPLIQTIERNISENLQNNKNNYCILMILTDGMINDLDDTITAIVEASFLPLSIIIVGIGDGDFSNMDFLDADHGVLTNKFQKKAARDIVQFVPFRKFANNGFMLAEEVLKEIPRQVVDYFKMINQLPGDPKA